MKKIITLFFVYTYSYYASFAANDNILWLRDSQIRKGDISIDDIPNIIRHMIDFFMGIAGTIAVIFVIVGAYKILFGSLQQDKTKWRDTIIAALGGFALAAMSWLIIRFIIDNLS